MSDEREYTGEPVFAPERPTATGVWGSTLGQGLVGAAANAQARPPLDMMLSEAQGLGEMLHPQLDKLLERIAPIMAPQPPSPCAPEQPGKTVGGSGYADRLALLITDLNRLVGKIAEATSRIEV